MAHFSCQFDFEESVSAQYIQFLSLDGFVFC